MIQEPFVEIKGSSKIGSKYVSVAKGMLEQLIDSNGSYFTKFFTFYDKDNLKDVKTLLMIKVELPEIYIYAEVQPLDNLIISGGLSIDELNIDPNFNLLYSRGSKNGFQPSSSLYVDYLVNSEYQQKYNYNINQAHYIYGSQYTGEMKNIVQLMLGTKIKINYKSDWNNTDLIYTDSISDKWLINISINGVICKKIDYQTASGVDGLVKIPDGNIITIDNATKILDTLFFYQNADTLNPLMGWSSNSNGSEFHNTNVVIGDSPFALKTKHYKINITEKPNTSPIELIANYTLIEQENLPLLKNDNFISPIVNNNRLSKLPINTNNYSYDISKIGSHYRLNFTQNFNKFNDLVIDYEYKCPIMTYFDDNDNLKVIYHYTKISNKVKEIITDNPDITSIEDYYYKDYNSNDLSGSIYYFGNLTINNDDYNTIGQDATVNDSPYGLNTFNKTIKHGFMVNNIEDELYEDNLGEINTKFTVINGDNISTDDIFVDQVRSNLLPVDLRPYESFQISNYASNSNTKLSQINSLIDEYYNKYWLTDRNDLTYDFQSYNVKLQKDLINYRLNDIDKDFTIPRLNEIKTFKDIEYKNLLQIRDISYSPFLYQINNNIKDLFDYFINNQSIYESNFDNCISILQDINASYVNIRDAFNDLQIYLRNLLDPSQKDSSGLTTTIINLNNDFIIPLNNFIDLINAKIDNFNSSYNGSIINTFISNFNEYFVLVKNYNDFNINTKKDISGVKLTELLTIIVNQDTPPSDTTVSQNRTENVYFCAQEIQRITLEKSQSISNRKLREHAFIFNTKDRSSYQILSQEKQYEDLNYYLASGINIISNIQSHFDNAFSNNYQFYMQEVVYTGGVPVYGDINPVDSSAFNFVTKTVIDYFGTSHNLLFPLIPDYDAPNSLILNLGFNTSFEDSHLIGKLGDTFTNTDYLSNKKYSIRDVLYNDTNLDYIPLLERTELSNFSDTKIIIDTEHPIDDARLFWMNTTYNNYKNFSYQSKNGLMKTSGTIFSNFLRDSFTYNYVVSKIGEYGQKQNFLTNITNYPYIIYNLNNVYPVNFIGKAF